MHYWILLLNKQGYGALKKPTKTDHGIVGMLHLVGSSVHRAFVAEDGMPEHATMRTKALKIS
jgi:hypothetical protein